MRGGRKRLSRRPASSSSTFQPPSSLLSFRQNALITISFLQHLGHVRPSSGDPFQQSCPPLILLAVTSLVVWIVLSSYCLLWLPLSFELSYPYIACFDSPCHVYRPALSEAAAPGMCGIDGGSLTLVVLSSHLGHTSHGTLHGTRSYLYSSSSYISSMCTSFYLLIPVFISVIVLNVLTLFCHQFHLCCTPLSVSHLRQTSRLECTVSRPLSGSQSLDKRWLPSQKPPLVQFRMIDQILFSYVICIYTYTLYTKRKCL